MRKTSTILRRFFDVYDYVEYFMQKHLEGMTIKEVEQAFMDENPFNKSIYTMQTYTKWIINYYMKDFQRKSLDIFARFITSSIISKATKRELIFWRTCRKDQITAELTKQIVFKRFIEGESHISKDDIKNFIKRNTNLSESTLQRALIGYLGLLKQIGIVRFNDNRIEFRYYRPRLESVSYVLFYLLEEQITPREILNSDDFKYFLLDERSIFTYLKDMRAKGIVEFAVAGDIVRIEPKIKFEVLVNVFEA